MWAVCVYLREASAAIVDFQVERAVHCLHINFQGSTIANLAKCF